MTATGTRVKPEPHDDRDAERDPPLQRIRRRLRVAERADRAPRAVIEVQAERDHRDDVKQRDPPDAEARDDVAVDVAIAVQSVMPRQPAGSIVSVVKCRMWKTMNTSSSTPPHLIVRDASVATCGSRFW